MVQVQKKNEAHCLASVGRELIEGDMADPAGGRFSRTILTAYGSEDRGLEDPVIEAALEEGHGVVSLWFTPGQSAPRQATVAFMHGGEPLVARGCVLWARGDDDRLVLVPFDASENFYFAVGPDGLERHDARPASALVAGMSRARKRFERTAREARHRDVSPASTS